MARRRVRSRPAHVAGMSGIERVEVRDKTQTALAHRISLGRAR